MELGKKVRAERIQRHMTIAALASASQLSKGFISQVESGQSNPSLASLKRISESLGLPLAELVADSPVGADRNRKPVVHKHQESRAQAVGEISTIVNTGAMVAATASLHLGGTIVSGPGVENTGDREGCCFVIAGAVRFGQADEVLDLSAGDALVWDCARPYSFENEHSEVAYLALLLPAHGELPEVVTGHGASTAGPRPTVAPEERTGPMRLVAMRAQRGSVGAEEGRLKR